MSEPRSPFEPVFGADGAPGEPSASASEPRRAERARRGRRPTQHARPDASKASAAGFAAVGVIGELLITAGVLIFAFLAWQLWWTDVQGNHAQAQIVQNLDFDPVPTAGASGAATSGTKIATEHHGTPPVIAEPALRTTFATLQVPRWDGEPVRPISEGTDWATVLNTLGIGHYEGTAMPGGLGNFAIAGHRTTYAKPFHRIAELVKGDPLVVRTKHTWYVYKVTSIEIVDPTDVAVVAPVPNKPGETPTKRMITMTSCTPMYTAVQRYIVHGELDYWAPVSEGTPAELVAAS